MHSNQSFFKPDSNLQKDTAAKRHTKCKKNLDLKALPHRGHFSHCPKSGLSHYVEQDLNV